MTMETKETFLTKQNRQIYVTANSRRDQMMRGVLHKTHALLTCTTGAFATMANRPSCALRVQLPVFVFLDPPSSMAIGTQITFSLLAPRKRGGGSFLDGLARLSDGAARWSVGGMVE